MNEYTTLADLKEYLTITDSNSDQMLRGFVTDASEMFNAETHRHFYPLTEIRYFDHPDNPTQLGLDDDLLEVKTFTTQNGDTAVVATDYFKMCGDGYNVQPYDRLVMDTDGDVPILLFSGTPQQANAITGIWGYHDDWDNAFDAVDVLKEDATADATSLTVADADGADLSGITPRLKVQHTIQVGSEHLYVTAVNVTTNVLTVRRGVNGTTAVAHSADDSVEVFRPIEDVGRAVKRLAAWLYAQRDTPYTPQIETGAGTTIIPQSAPSDVTRVALRYKRRSVR